MNALQVAPLSVKTTLPGPAGGTPAGEAPASSQKSKPAAAAYAEQQKQLTDARAATAKSSAERKAQLESAAAAPAAATPAPVDNFDRKVGFVDGSFEVFVDLVKPPSDEPVARVFGPPEHPVPQEAPKPQTTASASSAYARAAAALPLKDVGVA